MSATLRIIYFNKMTFGLSKPNIVSKFHNFRLKFNQIRTARLNFTKMATIQINSSYIWRL